MSQMAREVEEAKKEAAKARQKLHEGREAQAVTEKEFAKCRKELKAITK